MPKKKPGYAPLFIYPLLQRTLYATLSNLGEGGIHSRVMVFACDPELKRFFFLTGANSRKVAGLTKDPTASVCILSPSDKLDDHAETSIQGQVTVASDFKKAEARQGLALLSAKSTQIHALAKRRGLKDYRLLVLKPRSVTFRNYRDILKNVPPTLFYF